MSRFHIHDVMIGEDKANEFNEDNYRRNIEIPSGMFASAAYGYDKECGYFFQLFERVDGMEECVLDLDSFSNGLSGASLAHLLQILNGNPEHISNCFGDWPI